MLLSFVFSSCTLAQRVVAVNERQGQTNILSAAVVSKFQRFFKSGEAETSVLHKLCGSAHDYSSDYSLSSWAFWKNVGKNGLHSFGKQMF